MPVRAGQAAGGPWAQLPSHQPRSAAGFGQAPRVHLPGCPPESTCTAGPSPCCPGTRLASDCPPARHENAAFQHPTCWHTSRAFRIHDDWSPHAGPSSAPFPVKQAGGKLPVKISQPGNQDCSHKNMDALTEGCVVASTGNGRLRVFVSEDQHHQISS